MAPSVPRNMQGTLLRRYQPRIKMFQHYSRDRRRELNGTWDEFAHVSSRQITHWALVICSLVLSGFSSGFSELLWLTSLVAESKIANAFLHEGNLKLVDLWKDIANPFKSSSSTKIARSWFVMLSPLMVWRFTTPGLGNRIRSSLHAPLFNTVGWRTTSYISDILTWRKMALLFGASKPVSNSP